MTDEEERTVGHPTSNARHIKVQDSLADGFEPGPLPPMGPDGAPEIPPLRHLPVLEAPRLCEAGPCVNYHRFSMQLDAARPIADRLEEGGVLAGEAPPAAFHSETQHYCYPSPGVEMELGSLPVLECNRWEPVSPMRTNSRKAREHEYLSSEEGKAFIARAQAWEATNGTINSSEDPQ